MSHPATRPRGRLALPLLATLTLGLAALPALSQVPGAHAAARSRAHGLGGKAKHAKGAGSLAVFSPNFIKPLAVPSGPTVVTNCTTAGRSGPGGLLTALNTYATISFACAGTGPFTIDLGDSFEVASGEALSIDGSDGGRNDVTISGGATIFYTKTCPTSNLSGTGHQLFLVDFGGSLTLRNLTLTHGYAYNNDHSGGAVEAFGNLTADRDTFSDNGALDYGGALELATNSSTDAQTSAITNSTFYGNYTNCNDGGAIDINDVGDAGPQQVTLGHDTFTNNTTYHKDGGAIYADNSNNTVPTAILLSVATSVFRGNQALNGHNGGAVYLNEGNASIVDTLFDSNLATHSGGALDNNTGSSFLTTVARSTFVQNQADNEGGAIYSETPLRITNATITQNSSGSDGSAIYDAASTNEPLTIAASTINANVADNSSLEVPESVIHTDQPVGAAAIVNDSDSTLAIGTSIVYDNVDQGIIVADSRPFHANVVPAGTVLECSGPITDNFLNLSDLDTKAGTANSCGFTQTAPPAPSPDILVPVGTDIGLGPLGAYGGPTLGAPGNTSPTFTERLLKGSPAIDQIPAGSCVAADGTTALTADQRGFVRPYVALCDIGAFEVSSLASTSCSVAITFFSGGTSFALRTASAPATLVSYLALYGPAGLVQAAPQVPRVGVANTLFCTVPDPNASPVPTATTVTVDAQVARSTNPAVARFSYVRVVATRTASTETVTVSAINPDNTTGATLYTLTPFVQPQTFVVNLGTFTLYSPLS